MKHEWMIDVLTDLRRYAQRNDLPLLAGHLEEAVHLARVEGEVMLSEAPRVVQGEQAGTRSVSWTAGGGQRA